jgi:hypothetical protein
MKNNTTASLEFFYSANSNAPYLSGEHAWLRYRLSSSISCIRLATYLVFTRHGEGSLVLMDVTNGRDKYREVF